MKRSCCLFWIVATVAALLPLNRAFGDVVVYQVTNYWQEKSFGHEYHIDFASCTVSEPGGVGTAQALTKQSFSICRKESRVRFSVTHANGYVIDYDWVLEDGGRTVKGAYKDSNVGWGPSLGRALRTVSAATAPPPSAPPAASLAGKWAAYRGGQKTGDCSIVQEGAKLTFIIHRSPEERSTGRFLGPAQVVASDWGGQKGTVSPDARRIDWGNSFWKRVD